MNARTTMLTMLGGGLLLGLLFGATLDTTMKPSPVPHWRQLRAIDTPAHASPWELAEAGAQGLGPRWGEDRMPTWKRRALERAAAAASFVPLNASYEPEPALEPFVDVREAAAEDPADTVERPVAAAERGTAPDRATARSTRDAATAPAPAEPVTLAEEPMPRVIAITAGL